MRLELAHPEWLWALLLAAGPVVVAAARSRRGHRPGWLGPAMQVLAVALAALALAGPRASAGRSALPVLVLRDVSGSVRGQDADLNFPDDMRLERLAFARSVGTAASQDASATLAGGALRLAAARAGELSGVVIATDGQFQDDWRPAAAALGRAGLAVAIVPMDSPPRDARLAGVSAAWTAPGQARVRVTVRANTSTSRTLVLTAESAGTRRELARREINLLPGDWATLSFADEVAARASVVYTARLLGDDAIAENDAARAVLLAREPVVGVAAPAGADWLARLRQAGIEAEALDMGQASLADLLGYSALVLFRPAGEGDGGVEAADPLTEAAGAMLARYVLGGGGLVLVGEPPELREGDDRPTAADVTPLAIERTRRQPLRLVVVLDASGSMAEPDQAGGRRFDRAAEAVLSLRDHLTPRDELAVVAFAERPRVVYRADDGVDYSALRAALADVRPGGPTVVAPALEAAIAQPAGEGRQGLVLLVSDLRTQEFDAAAMARRFGRQGYELAVVDVGEDQSAQSPVAALARRLEAPVVARRDLKGLAEVFGQFVRQARGPLRRTGEFAVAARSPFGVDLAQPGPLDSYIPAVEQDDAQLLARVADDPLLATRQAGLGRSVVLAAELTGGANPRWSRSQQAAALLAGAVRWAQRPGDDPRFDGQIQRRDGLLALTIQAADGDGMPVNALDLEATVAALDDGQPTSGQLLQTAPGRYEAALPAGESPAVLVVRDAEGVTRWRQAWWPGPRPEYQQLGADWPALGELAALSGGRVVAASGAAAAMQQSMRREMAPLWPWLLSAAAAVMLAEWLLSKRTRMSRKEHHQ
jgi:Mg-chelatase subunit ChlD